MPSAPTLEPISPREATDWYLDHRRDDTRVATRRKLQSALGIFVDWTDQVDIESMSDLTGRALLRFKTWRKNETDVNAVSLNGNLAILRRFLRFCEDIEAVEPGLAEKVPLPNVPREEEISDVVPSDEAVEGIRSYLRKFEYASRRHTQFELIAEIGLRLGAIRAIDLDDLDLEGRRSFIRWRGGD